MSSTLIFSPPNAFKTSIFNFNSNQRNSLSLYLKNHSFSAIGRKLSRKANNILARSTSPPFIGKVGFQKREGNFSLLSFGTDPKWVLESEAKADASQILSAMFPFVASLTAVAALYQPSTFTWVSKVSYAHALGGIMLSIGIRLSIDDFALAFKRPAPLSVGFAAQYVLKPVLGVLVAQGFGMSPMFFSCLVLPWHNYQAMPAS